jgi:hypothetical protein
MRWRDQEYFYENGTSHWAYKLKWMVMVMMVTIMMVTFMTMMTMTNDDDDDDDLLRFFCSYTEFAKVK